MADNYVSIKIKADDTAKPDLTALRADLDELGSKVESAKVDVDDVDATAKLLAINAKLAALDKRAANPRITVAGAAKVEADIAAIDASLHHLGDQSATADVKVSSLRSRLLALGGAAGSVTGVGDAMTLASGEASMFQRVMAGASLATGLLEPVLAGVVVGTGVVASGFVAAGAGAGVFGLALKGVLSDVKNADQANVKLGGSLGEIQRQLNHTQTEWQRWVAGSASGVESVLGPALKLLPGLLSDATQFLQPVEAGLQIIISNVSQAMNSPFWKSTIGEWAATSGPMLVDIGTAIGNIAHGVAGILTTFMPMSTTMGAGLDELTAKFAKWGETLGSHGGFQSMMSTFKSETPLAMQLLKNLAVVIKNVADAMTGLATGSNSKALLQVLAPLSGTLATLSKNTDLVRVALYALATVDVGKKISGMFTGISNGLQTLDKGVNLLGTFGGAAEDASRGAKLASAATKVWTGIQAAFDVVMSANPIMLVVIAIAALVAAVVFAYTHFQTFRAIVNDVGNILKTVFIGYLHLAEAEVKIMVAIVSAAWQAILSFTTSEWGAIRAAVSVAVSAVRATLNWFASLPGLFRGWWGSAVNAVSSEAGSMLGVVRSLPGRILGALGNLGSLLFNAGRNVIQGLINGISSMIGSVGSAIGSIASEITSHLPFSPAKKGPLSGAGSPDRSGQRIAQMLGAGMTSGLPSVTAAAARLAGGASIGGSGAAGAGGAQRIQLEFAGSPTDPLLLWLRNSIRVRGGNVQAVLGH